MPRRDAVVAIDRRATPAGRRPADRCRRRAARDARAAPPRPSAPSARSSAASASSRLYWNCVRLTRSSTVRSCTGCMIELDAVAPSPARAAGGGSRRLPRCRARRAASASTWMRPLLSVVLVPSMPMNDDRLATAGSRRITARERLLSLGHRRERHRLRRLRDAEDHAGVLHREEALRDDDVEHDGEDEHARPRRAASRAGAPSTQRSVRRVAVDACARRPAPTRGRSAPAAPAACGAAGARTSSASASATPPPRSGS